MTLSANQHKAIAIVLFLSLTVFLRLGSGEIQPNEEGMNAMSAKSVINPGQLSDSSSLNKTDIYSLQKSTLTVWAISGAISVFGETTFAVRFFSALCSAIALVFFYFISRRFLTYSSSVISLFLLSGTLAWNNYARQGFSDLPEIAFILASLYFALKIFESEEKKQILIYSLLFALSLFLSIITHAFVWLISLFFVGFSFLYKNKKLQIRYLFFACIMGFLLSLPWFIFISSKHGNNIFYYLFGFNSILNFSGFSLPDIFNFNRIIITNPFIIFSFIYVLFSLNKISKLTANIEHGKYLNFIFELWLLAMFVFLIFTFSNHNNFIIYIIPPGIFLSMKFFDSVFLLTKSNKVVWIILTALIALFLWSFIFELREEIFLLFRGVQYPTLALLFIILVIGSILAAFILPKKVLEKFSAPGLYYAITFLPYLMIFKIILLNLASPTGNSLGAVRTSEFLKSATSNKFIYMYHESSPSDSINPQLDWYTDGWLSGWQKGRTYITVNLPKNIIDYKKIRFTDEFPDLIIVYYVHNDFSIKSAVMKDLLSTRSIILSKYNYIVFGKKNSERSYDKDI